MDIRRVFALAYNYALHARWALQLKHFNFKLTIANYKVMAGNVNTFLHNKKPSEILFGMCKSWEVE